VTLRSAAALLAALLAVAGCGGDAAPAPPPDVIVVLVDTLRADRTALLSPASSAPTTPALAAWARAGTRYTQAIAPSSWTLPSVAALFAGRDARAHALADQPGLSTRRGPDPEHPTLAERFRDGGYHTAALVANPLLTVSAGYARGFDEYVVAPAGSTDDLTATVGELRAWDAEALVARALSTLAAAPRDRPAFLYLHLMDPHVPYDPANAALAAPTPGWTAEEPGQPLVAWAAELSTDQRELLVGWRSGYDGQVAFTDRALGRLLERLPEVRPRAALVAVTADHGEGLFTHRRNPDSPPEPGPLGGAYGDHGEQLYEEALRVPLWLAGPGVPSRDETRAVALRDLGATLLALSGLPAEGPQLPLRPEDGAPEAIAGAGTRGWFLRSGDRKLLVPFPEREGQPGVSAQLFAVGERILPELEDLAAAEPERRDALLERWRAWRAERPEERLGPLDAETEQALQALGYLR
jgi:arylsulfatase A-like enzyme